MSRSPHVTRLPCELFMETTSVQSLIETIATQSRTPIGPSAADHARRDRVTSWVGSNSKPTRRASNGVSKAKAPQGSSMRSLVLARENERKKKAGATERESKPVTNIEESRSNPLNG